MHRGPRRNVCRYYMASGHCQYGDQCQFLHVRSGQPAEHRKPPSGMECVGRGRSHLLLSVHRAHGTCAARPQEGKCQGLHVDRNHMLFLSLWPPEHGPSLHQPLHEVSPSLTFISHVLSPSLTSSHPQPIMPRKSTSGMPSLSHCSLELCCLPPVQLH